MWSYDEWFAVPPRDDDNAALQQADSLVVAAHIEEHPFFGYASGSPAALRTWITQELVITGPFSQLLLRVAASLTNVHLRTLVLNVALSEHGAINEDGTAISSHPWLLHVLRESAGLSPTSIICHSETTTFLKCLHAQCRDPLRGIAALAVGNERMLIPEYTAIRSAFSKALPDVSYAPFLDANINEDRAHYLLLTRVASSLIATGANPTAYVLAAKRAVAARVRYYDALLERVRQEK